MIPTSSRFAKYLHKLTKSTQFIVITTDVAPWAAADRLYGITMQEKGVSTLVSVKSLIDDDLSGLRQRTQWDKSYRNEEKKR